MTGCAEIEVQEKKSQKQTKPVSLDTFSLQDSETFQSLSLHYSWFPEKENKIYLDPNL